MQVFIIDERMMGTADAVERLTIIHGLKSNHVPTMCLLMFFLSMLNY